MQEIRNFIGNALELRTSCTNPSICYSADIVESVPLFPGLRGIPHVVDNPARASAGSRESASSGEKGHRESSC